MLKKIIHNLKKIIQKRIKKDIKWWLLIKKNYKQNKNKFMILKKIQLLIGLSRLFFNASKHS